MLKVKYRYDAAGNRVAKIVNKDGEVTTNRLGNVLAVITDNVNFVNSTEYSECYERKA